ncbi:hypothetical protein [Methylobacterium crusticola]|uniref:hypothetical protein n=1 Tax=Methylobacterium crusticola TaxID=1697972 RepID=UPI000FFCA6C8|nr:hypothetical protein [Methylobacterium crusticola]
MTRADAVQSSKTSPPSTEGSLTLLSVDTEFVMKQLSEQASASAVMIEGAAPFHRSCARWLHATLIAISAQGWTSSSAVSHTYGVCCCGIVDAKPTLALRGLQPGRESQSRHVQKAAVEAIEVSWMVRR